MKNQTARLACTIGLIDALAFALVWVGMLAPFLAQANGPAAPALVTVFLLATLVAWRGAKNAQHVHAGNATYLHASAEGAAIGASVVLALFVLSWAAPAALAADHALDGFNSSRVRDWLVLVAILGPMLAIGAALGALHGLVLFVLNKWLVQRLAPR